MDGKHKQIVKYILSKTRDRVYGDRNLSKVYYNRVIREVRTIEMDSSSEYIDSVLKGLLTFLDSLEIAQVVEYNNSTYIIDIENGTAIDVGDNSTTEFDIHGILGLSAELM